MFYYHSETFYTKIKQAQRRKKWKYFANANKNKEDIRKTNAGYKVLIKDLARSEEVVPEKNGWIIQ